MMMMSSEVVYEDSADFTNVDVFDTDNYGTDIGNGWYDSINAGNFSADIDTYNID